IQVCTDYLGTAANGFTPTADATEKLRVKRLLGGNADMTGPNSPLFQRENSARFLLSIVGEIALTPEWNMYVILEGTPFQDSERALFTSMFSSSMFDNDYRIYGRGGLTYKF